MRDFLVFRTNVPQISQIDADLACESLQAQVFYLSNDPFLFF